MIRRLSKTMAMALAALTPHGTLPSTFRSFALAMLTGASRGGRFSPAVSPPAVTRRSTVMSYGFLDIAVTPSVRAAQAKMGADGMMHRRFACINNAPMHQADRRSHGAFAGAPTSIPVSAI
jgi:hypothetical protein